MDTASSLKRIEELLSVLVRMKLSESLDRHMKSAGYRTLYELTGRLPVKELAKRTGFSVGKISGIWQLWEKAGLVTRDGKQYRRVV